MQSQVACKRLNEDSNTASLKLIKLDDESLLLESSNDSFECSWCLRQFDLSTKQSHVEHCRNSLLNACNFCSRSLLNLNDHNRKTHIEHCRAKQINNKNKKRNKIKKNKNTDLDSNKYEKCSGYKPNVNFQTDSLYSNFPFQLLDSECENIKFVIENGVFHNINCAKKDYRLEKDHRNNVNTVCSELSYYKYLQNILKRSQISDEFNSIPHCYLSYNQLKSEIDQYRENLKKLKLENLNLKRSIDSLKNKEESYKRFINLLAQKEYSKLNQIITVCLNQKKGINGIIDKLLDTEDGIYHPSDKLATINQLDDVACKLCNDRVNIFKMRDHVTLHILNKDVNEHETRCGFCGLCDTCTIGIKVTNQAIWPESNCVYFKNFNLKTSNKKSSNHPIECKFCQKIIWSFNLKSHYANKHNETNISQNESDEENESKTDELPCKICQLKVSLTKMRDHIARHIIKNEIKDNSNNCGFCGLTGCEIQIKITSGKGKNTKYGPASNCDYFRKFNLKSSIRPTKSSPSTNRPIECHVCKKVYWSYNIKSHFSIDHKNEEPPEMIADLEKEMVSKALCA